MQIVSVKHVFKNYKDIGEVALMGWVRSNRDNGSIGFISFFDGTSINSVQLVYKKTDTQNFEDAKTARTGSAIYIEGVVVPSEKENQNFEIKLSNFRILKQADEDYPLQKKEHSPEFLRSISHLRARTNKFNTIMKLRSDMAFAIHNFFRQNDFVWVSTPIITSNDAEGAGENFYINSKERNYFDKQASLTVSGQLHAEAYAQTYKRVYTFGPTFRAEKSNTNRHISEFWMVEPEVAFCDINQLMFLIESFIKYLIKFALNNCKEEIAFLNKSIDNGLQQKLLDVYHSEFARVEYKEAIKELKQAITSGHKFEDNDIFFGKDLASEHERYLCEVKYKKPIFLYNFPQEIKAFYMKQNQDGTTVAACDLLVPGVGEIVGGSQREDDYKKIVKWCQLKGIKTDEIEWYLNIRRYGYFKSAGFGLGFERFLMYITGVNNIKDVIPFPRAYGTINF